MIGDIAIWVLIFIAGFYSGKKYNSLGELWQKVTDTVRGWAKKA